MIEFFTDVTHSQTLLPCYNLHAHQMLENASLQVSVVVI